jgi:hypothetical protein
LVHASEAGITGLSCKAEFRSIAGTAARSQAATNSAWKTILSLRSTGDKALEDSHQHERAKAFAARAAFPDGHTRVFPFGQNASI